MNRGGGSERDAPSSDQPPLSNERNTPLTAPTPAEPAAPTAPTAPAASAAEPTTSASATLNNPPTPPELPARIPRVTIIPASTLARASAASSADTAPATTPANTSASSPSAPSHPPTDSSASSVSEPSSSGSGSSASSVSGEPAPGESNMHDRLIEMVRNYQSIYDMFSPRSRDRTRESSEPGGAADDDVQAIVITVNYVFSDQNNPSNPNQSGSLIMSLPNNSNNREPRAIHEFIRLATQMAYSSIVNGLHTRQGITVDKFLSFPEVSRLSEEDKKCYICFEEMETAKPKREVEEGDRPVKKRRLYNASSETTSTDSLASRAASEAATEATEGSETTAASVEAKLLCNHAADFGHTAIELPCHHVFGQSCLAEWLKEHATCPLCREKLEERAPSHNPGFQFLSIPPDFNLGGEGNREAPRAPSPPSETPAPTTSTARVLRSLWPFGSAGRSPLTQQSVVFPAGVASRRTAGGVETTNDENYHRLMRDELLSRLHQRRQNNARENDGGNGESNGSESTGGSESNGANESTGGNETNGGANESNGDNESSGITNESNGDNGDNGDNNS
ncbi:hypothetical protein DICA0_E11562 [Diutina catenulata]